MNVANSLLRVAQTRPKAPAVHSQGAVMSYDELCVRTGRMAGMLSAMGVSPDDRVALMLGNEPAFILAYFAIQRIGAICVSVSTMCTRREVEFILQDSGARVAIVEAELRDRVPTDGGLVILSLESPGGLDPLGDGRTPMEGCRGREPGAPAAILYTSGTTGVPKGATLSVANIITNAQAAISVYGASSEAGFICFLPLFHCSAQNGIMNAACAAGASIVLHRRFSPEAVFSSVRSGHVTHFVAVPSVYVRLLGAAPSREDFRAVRQFVSAAAPLPTTVAERWAEVTGKDIYEAYGLTETSPFVTASNATTFRLGSVGKVVQDVRARVVDGQGRVASVGVAGEVEVAGPNIMLGYWNRPEPTAEAIRDGWLRTGDLGRFDEDGFLYIVGRIKEMVVVSGYKVVPMEVEDVLLQHPAVLEAAVYGVAHPVTGETVHACVVLRTGFAVDATELMAFCAERLTKYKVPREIRVTAALPKTASGKVRRQELREDEIRTTSRTV